METWAPLSTNKLVHDQNIRGKIAVIHEPKFSWWTKIPGLRMAPEYSSDVTEDFRTVGRVSQQADRVYPNSHECPITQESSSWASHLLSRSLMGKIYSVYEQIGKLVHEPSSGTYYVCEAQAPLYMRLRYKMSIWMLVIVSFKLFFHLICVFSKCYMYCSWQKNVTSFVVKCISQFFRLKDKCVCLLKWWFRHYWKAWIWTFLMKQNMTTLKMWSACRSF